MKRPRGVRGSSRPGRRTDGENLRAIVFDPPAYARAFFDVELWPVQAEIARSVFEHPRTSVAACTGSGKTFDAAVVAMEWITAFDDGIVVATSSRMEQLKAQMMGEIRTLCERGRDRVAWPAPSTTKLELGPKRYIQCIAPSTEAGWGGYHQGHVLVIADEASDLEDHAYAGMEGPLSSGVAHLLELGNPLQVGDNFHRHHSHRDEMPLYNRIRIPAWRTPNFRWLGGDDVPEEEKLDRLLLTPDEEIAQHITHPALISPLWVKGRHKAWGPGHPSWEARVRANFPDSSIKRLIPLSWANRSGDKIAGVKIDPEWPIWIGCDVAGPGDAETILQPLTGPAANIILPPFAIENPDPRGEAVAFLQQFERRLRVVTVDAVGIGYNFALHLRDQPGIGDKVRMVNVGEEAKDPAQFVNRRSEGFWSLREDFEDGTLIGLLDQETVAQLGALPWDVNSRGQTFIVPKKQLKGFWDRADGLMLARLHVGDHGKTILDRTVERLAGSREDRRLPRVKGTRLDRWRNM